VVELARELLHTLDRRRIAVLGLAFKQNTDDVREAASIRVIYQLVKFGAHVVARDPMPIENARKVLPGSVLFEGDPKSAVKDADCAIVMTEWNELKNLTAQDYSILMRCANVVDARPLYDPEDFKELNYRAIGMGNRSNTT
jgi:UDPglucose 6-dehydrogenase